MYKMFDSVRTWLTHFFEVEAGAEQHGDPLSSMSPRELADLPVYHPRFDSSIGA
jgi:hypothetical protein